MKFDKAFLIILSLFVQIYLVTSAHADPAWIKKKVEAQEMFFSVSLPKKDRLTLVSFVRIFAAGKLLGGLAAYDDAVTERTADYLELYNSAGFLIAIGWFDRFGIERVAVDRALLENADKLEGVFVVFVDGDSI
jgi:hypothetical protein